MADADDVRRLALALSGTTEAAHFERRAFRADRIYATVAADGLTANLSLDPMQQEILCDAQPEAFARIGNAWGAQGWTTVTLAALSVDQLAQVLESAWRHHGVKVKRPKR